MLKYIYVVLTTAYKGANHSDTSPSKRGRLHAVDVTKFFAVIHIVLFNFYRSNNIGNVKESSVFNNFAIYGVCEYSYLFALSGFVLTWGYGDSAATLCTRHFWIKRFSKLYPVYFTSIFAEIAIGRLNHAERVVIPENV